MREGIGGHTDLSGVGRVIIYQAPPSMGFSRQEYWSGVPLPSPLKCLIVDILVIFVE